MGLLNSLKSLFTQRQASVISDGEGHWWQPVSAWGVHDTHSGEEVTEAKVLTSSTCYACSKALAETIAGLPAGIYQQFENRKEKAGSEAAQDLLINEPNPEMDPFTFWELMVTRMTNAGNFFAEIQRDRSDRPVALWPIHPSRVKPIRDNAGELIWEISSDYRGDPRYEDPYWRKDNLRYLSPRNMLNVVGFGSYNGILARGVLPGAQEIGIDLATIRYGGNFFSKGAMPSGMVEHPNFINDPAKRAQFRSDLNEIHSNKDGPGGIGVLWQGATYKQVSVSPEQAQFLETRKYTSRQLCKLYGVPPAIIGDYEDSKFATADAMVRAFVMVTLRNLVVRIESALNRQLLKVRNSSGKLVKAFEKPLIYELALDGLLRGDPKAQAETWRTMRESGVATANEWRDDLGMNPIQGKEGEYLIVPGGFTRLDKIDNQGNRPKNESSSNADDNTETEEAKTPEFDRQAFAKMIEDSGLVPTKTQVNGFAPVQEAAVEIAQAAVSRIHSITLNQISRWREQDPAKVAEKLPEFWEKQHARLLEALAPCDTIVNCAKEGTFVAEDLTRTYIAKLSQLDNYDIFDEAKTAPIGEEEIENLIRVSLC